MQVKKQQLEPNMEQWISSKLGKDFHKTVYCHFAYLTLMQSTSWEMRGWMKLKLESRLLGEISHLITSWQTDEETIETVRYFIFLVPKLLQMVTAAMKWKHTCSLEEKLLQT